MSSSNEEYDTFKTSSNENEDGDELKEFGNNPNENHNHEKTHHVYKGGDAALFDDNDKPLQPADGVPNKTVIHIIVDSSVTNIGKGAFCHCDKLVTIQIPESVTSIGKGAFLGCSSLATIKIPDSVTSIGYGAFDGCSSLATIEIPKSVTSIGEYAFQDCSSLATIEIPESVTSIGEGTFLRCSSLATIEIPKSVTSIGEYAFQDCSSLATIEIPESVTSIGDGAFRDCSSLATIQIPDSVTSIGEGAFNGCSSLATIQIPDSVASIGDWAFTDCSSLATIEIPKSVTSIGYAVFNGCSSLATIKIPESVTSIGEYAFQDCSSLATIEIPESVTSIGEGTFLRCSSLATIEIPKSVTSIGKGAFQDCSSLATIEIPESVTSIGVSAFCCSSLATIRIPDLVTSISNYTFYDCSSLATVQIPQSVTSIGDATFYLCSSLESINVPNSIQSIGDHAFGRCISLGGIQIPDSVTSIGETIFSDCSISKFEDIAPSPNKFPLHDLCHRNNDELSVESMSKLLNQEADIWNTTDSYGRTALHALAKNPCVTVELLDRLLNEQKDLSTKKDAFGYLPIHYVCSNTGASKSQGVLRALIQASIPSLSISAGIDGVPFKIALKNSFSDLGELLFACHPFGKSSVNPVDLGQLQEIAQKYIANINENPPKSQVDFDLSLQHGWVTLVSTQEVLDIKTNTDEESHAEPDQEPRMGTIEDECIKFIKNCTKDTAKILAKAKNASGRSAMEIAVVRIQEELKRQLLFLRRYDVVAVPPLHLSATCIVVKAYDESKRDDYSKRFDDFLSHRTQKTLSKGDFKEILLKRFVVKDEELIENLFKKYDYKKDNQISKEEFITMCEFEFDGGQRHEVAFKFMKDEQQFRREIHTRKNNELDNKFIVSGEDCHLVADSNKVDGDDEKDDISSGLNKDVAADFEMYQHALLMPYADRDLNAIFLSERPEIGQIRNYIKQIAEALQHLHGNDIIHGDLKLLNVVRLGGRLVLIDLDASVKMNSYAGCKFSSGVLPPEMICCIKQKEDLNKFNKYFEDEWNTERESDKDIHSRWDKIQPKLTNNKDAAYVVKTFNSQTKSKTNVLGGAILTERPVLPENWLYDLVEATSAFDAWSLGVILFTLLTGQPLFPVNRDDDLKNANAMKELFDWNDETSLKTKLNEVPTIPMSAQDLLHNLLQRDPLKRYTMDKVLEHEFIKTDDKLKQLKTDLEHAKKQQNKKEIEKLEKLMQLLIESQEKGVRDINRHTSEGFEKVLLRQQIIMNMSQHMQDELSRTRSILLYGMFEATEVQTPTAFVITKKKVIKPTKPSTNSNDKFNIEDLLDKNGKGFKPEALLNKDQKKMVKDIQKQVDEAKLWTSRVANICTGVLDGNIGDIFGTVKDVLGDLVTEEKMYFYFIDELTGEPVLGSGYPKVITTPSELVPKLLPLMQVSMRAISLCNGAAGIARMFGFPLPKIPEDVRTNMQDSVNILKQESSVQKFGPLKSVVNDLKEDSEKTESSDQNVRGESLRQLLKFLEKEIKEQKFAGLNRYPDPRSGKAIWTTLKTTEEVENAIEKISNDRRKEEDASSKNKEEALQQEVERLKMQISNGVKCVPAGQYEREEDILVESDENEANGSVEDLKSKAERKREAFIQEFKNLKMQIQEKETAEELDEVMDKVVKQELEQENDLRKVQEQSLKDKEQRIEELENENKRLKQGNRTSPDPVESACCAIM